MNGKVEDEPGHRGWIPGAVACALLVAVLALYGRAANFEFVWDDVLAIRDNPIMRGPLGSGLVATQNDHLDPNIRHLSGVKPAHDSYRPLLFLSYRMDVELFGMSARAMHLHNVILGLLSAVVFLGVARRWLGAEIPALIATAVFALHPIQVESITYISGRGDLLAGLFALISTYCAFIAFEHQRPSRLRGCMWMAFGCMAFIASLLCKEAYLGLPIAIAGILIVRGDLRKHAWIPISMIVVLGMYLAVRTTLAGAGTGGTGASAALALPGICLHYLRIVLLPDDLSTERLYVAGYLMWGWLMVAGLVVTAVLLLRRGSRWQNLLVVLSGLLWMFVLIGPSALVIVMQKTVADRYAYLPVAGFAIAWAGLLCWAIQKFRAIRIPLATCACIWGTMLVAIGWNQVSVWQSSRTLYAHAVAMAPDSSMAFYRLGFTYAANGECSAAIPVFQRAVALDPRNSRALNNLGVCYMQTDQLPAAEDALVRALEVTDGLYFRGWYNLGATRIAMGFVHKGCENVQAALRINPGYASARALFDSRCADQPGGED